MALISPARLTKSIRMPRPSRTKSPNRSKPYDQAFKFLAEQDVEALLELLQARPDDLVSITPLPREISVAALLPDQLIW